MARPTASAEKTSSPTSQHGPRSENSAGAAVAPPSYGIDLLDQASSEEIAEFEAPAEVVQRQSRSFSVNGSPPAGPPDGDGEEQLSYPLQAKLKIGPANDQYEREADRAAQQVIRMPEPNIQRKYAQCQTEAGIQQNPLASQITPRVRVMPSAPNEEEAVTILTKAQNERTEVATPSLTHQIQNIQGRGQALDAGVQSLMEARFGTDFSGVKIHTGAKAAHLNQELKARAFTVGRDIFFSQGSYNPRSLAGRHLLAHELTHVVQQKGRSTAVIQRDMPSNAPAIPSTTPEVLSLLPSEAPQQIELRQWVDQGIAELVYGGLPWIIIHWTPGPDHRLENISLTTGAVGHTGTIRLTIQAQFEARVYIDRLAEQRMSDNLYRGHLIVERDFRFAGAANYITNQEQEITRRLPRVIRHDYVPVWFEWPQLQFIERIRDEDAAAPAAPEAEPPPPPRHRTWTLASLESFENFAGSHPNTRWAGIELENGEVVAFALTTEHMRRIAEDVRNQRYDFEILSEYEGANVASLFVFGEEVELESLRNLYFRSEREAAEGVTGELVECEIYRMEGLSYGRHPLTHDEAVARWLELDQQTAQQIHEREVFPGHRFLGLRVRGAGALHYLDINHFRARDQLFELSQQSTHPLLLNPESAMMDYLVVEADREQEDPRVRTLLEGERGILEALQERIYRQVEDRANRLAINAIRPYARQIRELADSPQAMGRWLTNFPDMSEDERYEALAMIGFHRYPPGTLPFMVAHFETAQTEGIESYLRDRASVNRVILGLEFLTLDHLQGGAAGVATGLERLLEQLESNQVHVLGIEGDIGLQSRTLAYRDMGFSHLRPENYPHGVETSGIFPGPLSGEAADFSTLAEQLYANYVSRRSSIETAETIAIIAGIAIGTAILILIANAAGAAVAGGLLGLAEGTMAYTVTYTVTSAAVFTGLEIAATHILTGQGPIDLADPEGSAERVGTQFGINLATFGFFQALNSIFMSVGRSGARLIFQLGAEEALTGGATATAHGIRISALGLSFLTANFARFRLERGRLPSLEEAAVLASEAILPLVAMEVGGVLARPAMERIGFWAHARQLATLDPAARTRVENLLSQINTVQRDLAATAANPESTGRDIIRIMEAQERLLAEQRSVVNELKETLLHQGAGAQVEQFATAELNRIELALQVIRDARFIDQAGIRALGEPLRPTDPLEFTYREGNIEAIQERYQSNDVTVEENGVVRIRHEGRELIFYPESAAPDRSRVAPTVQTRQEALNERLQNIVAQADLLGFGEYAIIETIRGRQPLRTRRLSTLEETERLVGEAEQQLGPELQRRAQAGWRRHRQRLGAEAMARLRTGRFAGMTQEQIGAMLYGVPIAQGLGEAQLRGILHLVAGPTSGSRGRLISVEAFFNRASSGGNVQQRNFILDAFGRLMDQRVPGTYEVLSDMIRTNDDWRGGAWMMEYARTNVGLDRIAAFEHPEPVPGIAGSRRDYDIILTDGTRLELKAWRIWRPDTVRSQFRRDILINTNDLTNPAGIRQVRWVFRSPEDMSGLPGQSGIRAVMRETLDQLISERGINESRAQQLREALDTHDGLVEISNITFDSVPLQPQPSTPRQPLHLPPPGREEEEEPAEAVLP